MDGLCSNLLENLCTLLKEPKQSTGFVVRPGVNQDIIKDDVVTTDEAKILNNELDFEFQDKVDEEEDDFSNDPRKIAEYTWSEFEETGIEETETVKNLLTSKRNYVNLKIFLPDEDVKTLDIDLKTDQLVFYSHQYKLKFYFPKIISDVKPLKTIWNMEKHCLELKLKLT